MFERDDSRHDLLSPSDDEFHPPGNHRWFHETSWFSFYVPERRMGAWLYNWTRPNIGTSGGGLWVYDSSSWFHMQVPYYACYANLPLPSESDAKAMRFPSGAVIETLEPLMTYRLGFTDRDIVNLDLTFEATMPPWVGDPVGDPPAAHHLDQIGRVSGTMMLRGEAIVVDCFAMRDRSWNPRSERWKDGHVGYCSAANEGLAFFAQSASGTRGESEERVQSGFFLRDGHRAKIIDGSRELERDPEHGFLRSIRVEAEDTAGRRVIATGTRASTMAMPIPGVHGVCWTTLVNWDIDGVQLWGDDQDAWPLHEWARFRRTEHGAPST